MQIWYSWCIFVGWLFEAPTNIIEEHAVFEGEIPRAV
jgi:hypothetical protein